MTNVQHQIQADRSGKIWINVSNNDPRLNVYGVIARIRPKSIYDYEYIIYELGLSKRSTSGIYKQIKALEDTRNFRML